MLFNQYQEVQQVWRLSPPTNIYSEDTWLTDDGWSLSIGYEDVSTSGGIYKRNFFRESTVNIDINLTVSDATNIVLCGELEDGTFMPLKDFPVTSGGTYSITHTISGMLFYTGLGFIFSTSVSGMVNWVYVGDKTYATQNTEFLDSTWKYIGAISGRIEPVGAGFIALKNNQTFADVGEVDLVPLSYETLLKPLDVVIDIRGVAHQIVGEPEVYRYMMPHIALYLKRIAWEVP